MCIGNVMFSHLLGFGFQLLDCFFVCIDAVSLFYAMSNLNSVLWIQWLDVYLAKIYKHLGYKDAAYKLGICFLDLLKKKESDIKVEILGWVAVRGMVELCYTRIGIGRCLKRKAADFSDLWVKQIGKIRRDAERKVDYDEFDEKKIKWHKMSNSENNLIVITKDSLRQVLIT